MRERFFDAFHRSLAAIADAGNNLVVEHILDTPGWRQQLAALLASHDVLFVGLHCSLDELERREKMRGDRRPGSAEADYYAIHQGLAYDLEVDAESGLEASTRVILEAWSGPRPRSAFFNP
jgi:chloramphenicol 3-O phosphotransferase